MSSIKKFSYLALLLGLGMGQVERVRAADYISLTPVAAATSQTGGAAPSEDTKPAGEKATVSPWTGFIQGEVARTYADPEHWSKARLRGELVRKGQFSESVKWTIGGRLDYDAVYDRSSFYPPQVKDDQRYEFSWRENYLDISAGNWEFRLGRQHIVWGEMVGLFFADVVSAKDMREFLLPEFGQLRIPQWAARAEYFMGDNKAELLWIPVPSFDNIGKPGADFFPHPLPVPAPLYVPEHQPARKLSNTNYGLRFSRLKDGWDMSGFYYHSVDAAPTFYRVSPPGQPFVFQPRHEKIDQVGGTVAKDIEGVVFKGELVYTDGRKFNVLRPTQPDGLVKQNTLDYALGLDFTLAGDMRLNVQLFQRIFFSHDPGIIPEKRESGASVFLSDKLGQNLEAQVLLVHSLNRSDWMLRPQVFWNFERNWRLSVGADIFGGPVTGFFGRYDRNDRVYAEVRRSF